MDAFKNDKQFDIRKAFSWKYFWIILLLTFIVQALGIITRREGISVLRPIPVSADSLKEHILQKVRSLLYKTPNTFMPRGSAEATLEESDMQNPHAYLALDFDSGQLISQKNMNERLAIASLTKMMTAVVAMDLASSTDVFEVTKRASSQVPTKIAILPGEKFTLEELLYASLMTSANDATYVIKEGINKKYGAPIFEEAMNEKARFLGLTSTHFDNPQGFDSRNNYSSAYDLSIIAHYLLTQYPLLAQIVETDYQLIPANKHHRQFELYNWNGLLGVYPNVYGVKIGNTGDAGTTTAVVAQRAGEKILVVVLGTSGVLERDLTASSLLDLSFEKNLGLAHVGITQWQLLQKYATWRYWN